MDNEMSLSKVYTSRQHESPVNLKVDFVRTADRRSENLIICTPEVVGNFYDWPKMK